MKKFFYFALLLLIIVAGASFFIDDTKNENAGCGDVAKPCSLDEIEDILVEQSFEIADRVQEMANQSLEISGIVAELEKEDLEELYTGPEAVFFRLKNGPLMVIEAEEKSALSDEEVALEVQEVEIENKFELGTKGYVAKAQSSEEINVTANQKGDPAREEKSALVLAPNLWDFGSDDDGPIVKDILERNRNFEGNITYLSNPTKGANNVKLTDFIGWSKYDVVHLSTHGLVACKKATEGEIEIITAGESNLCKTLIDTGFKFKNKKEWKKAKDTVGRIPGVALSRTTMYLTPDFFTLMFGSELENTIITFSACEIGRRSDMVGAMSSIIENGHFMYWTNSVNADDASAVTKELYGNLVDKGMNAMKAYEEIDDSLKKGKESEFDITFTDKDGKSIDAEIETTTDFEIVSKGQNLHAIENLTMMDNKTGKELRSGEVFDFVGTYGDGKNEKMTIEIELEGYSNAEIESKGMTISFLVNGETFVSKETILPDTNKNDFIEIEPGKDDTSIIVRLVDFEIMDLEEDQAVEFKAKLNFNEENFAVQTLSVLTSLPDVKAVEKTTGLTITYDADTDAAQISAEGETMFLDRAGFTYVNADGWKKINFVQMGSLGTRVAGSQESLKKIAPKLEEYNIEVDRDGPLFYPIIDIAAKAQLAGLGQNPAAKKSEIKCNNQDCTKFVISEGGSTGTVIFDASGRLVEFGAEGVVFNYTYGDYDVNLPSAQELVVPKLPAIPNVPNIPFNAIPGFPSF